VLVAHQSLGVPKPKVLVNNIPPCFRWDGSGGSGFRGGRIAHPDRGRRLVFPRGQPTCDRHLECTSGTGRRRASFHRGAAFQELLGRSKPGLFRRRHYGEPHFKGKNIDTKEISKDLGVRYVLEGSVRRDQNRERVNAQLIDGETSAHL
jgi:hypothetical protein